MNEPTAKNYLSQILTHWSQIQQAQLGPGDRAEAARRALLVRYHGAVYSYLLARLRDPNAADQVCSEFAVRVLENHAFLQRATPGPSLGTRPGRFRYYLKAILSRMVIDYYRTQQKEGRLKTAPSPDEGLEIADPRPGASEEEDQEFREVWRQELLNRAWEALEEMERRTGQPYATLLQLHRESPALRSHQLAELLAEKLGRPYSAAGVRQILHRSRGLIGQLLVQEVTHSLQTSPDEPVGPEDVEQELIDLGLYFKYVRSALERTTQSA